MTTRHQLLFSICIVTIVLGIFSVYLVQQKQQRDDLKLVFLDVGQGDALYIETPNKTQVLVDAGGDGDVLHELQKVMPFADRSIDLVVITNPDKDHIGGFVDVFERYTVTNILEPGTFSSSDTYEVVASMADNEATYYLAKNGMKILLDAKRNIYLEVIFPDTDVSGYKTNEGSLVMRLVYGNRSALLTGDTVTSIEEHMVSQYKEMLQADILKVAHHGSKTSTSEVFLSVVDPMLAVISYGEGNSYGHPHDEVVKRLEKYQIPYLSTANEGSIILTTDGEVWRRK